MHLLQIFFFNGNLKYFMNFRGQNILKKAWNIFTFNFFWNFFRNSSILLLVAPNFSAFISKKMFQQIWKYFMTYNLFSSSVYNAVSVLSTNKLVQNISRCNTSVVFVSNHCSPTIFLYPHFLVLQLSSISNQSINLQSTNFTKFICLLPPSYRYTISLIFNISTYLFN